MNFLKEHGEKIATAIIVLVCGYFISAALSTGDSDDVKKLEDWKSVIDNAIRTNSVKDDWTWSQKKQPQMAKQLNVNFERANEPISGTPTAYSSYPQPDKPWVVVDGNKAKEIDRPKVPAILTTPQEFKADPDHGRVYVHFKLPTNTKYFTPIRVEIFRGSDAKKVDQLIGTINLNPEEEIPVEEPKKEEPKKEGAEDNTDPEKKEPKKAVDPRETARTRKKEPTETQPDAPPAAPEAEKGGVPAEFAGVIVFTDNNVDPKKNFFYKARLVGRLFKTNEKNYLKDPERKKEIEVVIPAELTPVTPTSGNEGIRLFATVYSDVAQVTTPPNYILRFAGVVDGELPPADQVLPPGFKPTYKGNFGVRVWVPAIKNFAKDDLQVPIDGSIKGTVKFKNEASKQDSVAYETGYELVEIKRAMKKSKKIRKVAKVDAEGNPVKDGEGKPVFEEKEVEGPAIETEVAVVRDTLNKDTLEEVVKGADEGSRKDAAAWLDRLAKEQEEERKKKEQEMKALRDKIKANKGKTPPTTAPVVPPATNKPSSGGFKG